VKPLIELEFAEGGGIICIAKYRFRLRYYLVFDIRRGLQEDVSHTSRVFPEAGPKPKVFGAHRHRTGGQQTVPVRVPQVIVAGGRQGRPTSPASAVHAPRFAVHW